MNSLFYLVFSVLFFSSSAFCVPDCLDLAGTPIPIQNAQVLNWKHSTANQFRAHVHIQGILVAVLRGEPGHIHFEIRIGDKTDDTLEVIYNTNFGALPNLEYGMTVEACGDYITSNAPTPQFPASPLGAIIHWLHRSTKPLKHESGYVVINNITYGL